ncbi:conserved protein of unknown function [Methylocella tundrae]|uniref:Uncharacterized protein n=1 Tax=Methylocella tundrae TaxID=227605 RepID=A0A4U8Z404_METTU|nr:conserved protein of unknown function [Methylocella tundrae]
MVGQDHFHEVEVEVVERRDKFGKQQKVGDRSGAASLGNVFRWRQLPPVGLADEDDPVTAEALRQKRYGAGDSPSDPRRTDAGRDTDLLVGDIAGSVAMDELHTISDAEFFGAAFRLIAEQPAHVDPGADDIVVACPGAQHLARTAAKVEDTGSRFQAQRRSESGELVGREGVMDAVSALRYVEDPGDVHGSTALRGNWITNRRQAAVPAIEAVSATPGADVQRPDSHPLPPRGSKLYSCNNHVAVPIFILSGAPVNLVFSQVFFESDRKPSKT